MRACDRKMEEIPARYQGLPCLRCSEKTRVDVPLSRLPRVNPSGNTRGSCPSVGVSPKEKEYRIGTRSVPYETALR